MIDPKCCRCKKELEAKGGVLLMPPSRSFQVLTLEADLVGKLHLCVECAADVIKFLADTSSRWEDVPDEWTAAIGAAHPARSESHEKYGVAMKMVSHRHSKGSLVALVNWLLVRLKTSRAATLLEAEQVIREVLPGHWTAIERFREMSTTGPLPTKDTR